MESSVRTLAPDINQAVVALTFTPGADVVDESGGPVTEPVIVVYPAQTDVSLDSGTWALAARGYRSNAAYTEDPSLYFAEYTQENIIIRSGEKVEVTIRFTPKISGAGLTGLFSWHIIIPGADTAGASMTLTKADGTAIPELENIDLRSEAVNPSPVAVSLPVGYYLLNAVFTSVVGQETGRIDAVHIYENMETRAAYTFDGHGYTSQVHLSGTIKNIDYPAYTPKRVEAFYPGGLSVPGQEFIGITAGSGESPATWNLSLPAFSYTEPGSSDYPNGSRSFVLKVYMLNDDDKGGYSREIPVTLDLIGRTDIELPVEKYTLDHTVSTGDGRETGTLGFNPPAAFEGEEVTVTLTFDAATSWLDASSLTGKYGGGAGTPFNSFERQNSTYTLNMPRGDLYLTVTFNTPAKPNLPVIGSNAAGVLNVEWDAALNAQGYEVWYGVSDFTKWNGAITPDGTKRKTTISDLDKGKRYYVRVRGMGPSGETGAFSDTADEITLLDTPTLAAPTTNDNRSLDLSWEPVEGAASYEVRFIDTDHLDGNGPDAVGVKTLVVNAASAALADINPNLKYRIWVRARNNEGAVSLWSDYQEKQAGISGIILEQEDIQVSPSGDITIYKVGDDITRFTTVTVEVSFPTPEEDEEETIIAWNVGNKTAAEFNQQYPGALEESESGNTLLINAAKLPLGQYTVYLRVTQRGILFVRKIPVSVQR
jgi:hypothetical protein